MSAYSDKIAKQKQQGFFRTADVENGEITHTIAYLLEDMVVFDDKKDVLVFTDTGCISDSTAKTVSRACG